VRRFAVLRGAGWVAESPQDARASVVYELIRTGSKKPRTNGTTYNIRVHEQIVTMAVYELHDLLMSACVVRSDELA
jgi:hypothetical protein